MGALSDAVGSSTRRDEQYVEGVYSAEEAIDDELDLSFFEFHGLELERCSFVGANLQKASFYDCTFMGCDLSNANLTGAYFARTRLEDCKLEGAQLTDAIVRSSRFVRCQCRYVGFGGAKLEGVTLSGCDMREAFMNEVRLRRSTRFESCSLVRADFFRTPLKGTDLSTCDISGIMVSDTRSELRGAIIGVEQAVDVALMLGVRIAGYE